MALQEAAFYSNGKIKPNVVLARKNPKEKPIEETHPEGAYHLYYNRQWIPVGAGALQAQRQWNARRDSREGASSTPSKAAA